MAKDVKYVRLGISPEDDKLLDRLADDAFKGALKKVDVGRLLLQYALDHYGAALDWYRDRGLAVIAEEKKPK